jgi:hypothetical protein
MSVAQILEFLRDDAKYETGLMLSEPPRLVGGLGRSARMVQTWEVMRRATVGEHSYGGDFTFVPCNRRRHPPRTGVSKGLYMWALRNKLPYIYLHDNDHAWFSGFGAPVEKKVFLRFLSQSVFQVEPRCLHMASNDWRTVRRGIYQHGWTLHRASCEYRKGVARYSLWAGVPQVSIIVSDERARLSANRFRLTITKDRDGSLAIVQSSGRCPLDDNYGSRNPPASRMSEVVVARS